MILLFLFLTLIILISYPIIGFKIYKSIRNKDKRKLYRLLTILLTLVLIPGFFWRLLPGSDLVWRPIEKVQEKGYNTELTGFEFNFGDPIYEYESKRDFNGDGYSIWIYEIDDKTAQYFKNPNAEFFIDYPSSDFRKDWETEFWKKTPFNKEEQKFFNFAHKDLDELEFELEDLLYEKENYYAYEYYMHDFSDGTVYVGNIDFYILCPNRKLIVKINHNT